MKKYLNKLFDGMQQVGAALMLPVAVLPAAGLLMGIGYTLNNATLLSLCPFFGNAFWSGIANLFQSVSNVVFGNLPLLFAIGVAAGLCDNDAPAALAAALGMLVTHATINMVLGITPETIAANGFMYTNVLGINSLQIGPFGGVIVGCVASLCYKKFYNVRLPQVLAFFSGKRCVPIMTSLASVILGVVFSFVWPPVQKILNMAALGLVRQDGTVNIAALGIVIFLITFLILFGLHHCIYPIFYYQLGTYTTLAGVTVTGDNNIYFAQLADGMVPTHGLYIVGGYIMAMFILPSILLAVYHCADKERKAETKSICLSAGFTSFLTGVTEPAEFTYAFAAFPLYFIGRVILSITAVLLITLGMRGSSTFCAGLFDFTLGVIIPGAPRWVLLPVFGMAAGILMYFISVVIIRKFDLKTPGREGKANQTIVKNDSMVDGIFAEKIVELYGGRENIKKVAACVTRLRIECVEPDKVDKTGLEAMGAMGVLTVSNNVQSVFGGKAAIIRDEINKII